MVTAARVIEGKKEGVCSKEDAASLVASGAYCAGLGVVVGIGLVPSRIGVSSLGMLGV